MEKQEGKTHIQEHIDRMLSDMEQAAGKAENALDRIIEGGLDAAVEAATHLTTLLANAYGVHPADGVQFSQDMIKHWEKMGKEDLRAEIELLKRAIWAKILDIKEENQIEVNIKVAEDAPAYIAKYPDNLDLAMAKVAHKILGNEIKKSESLRIEELGKKELSATVSLTFNELESVDFSGLTKSDNVKIGTRRPFEPFDLLVQAAIAKWYNEGHSYITLQMINQVITGGGSTELTDNAAQRITDSLTLQMYSIVAIDSTKEGKAYPGLPLKQDGPLINAVRREERWTQNGKNVIGIQILSLPILHEYSQAKGQLCTIPLSVLDTPGRKTLENINLTGYLLNQISIAQRMGKKIREINYETIFKALDIEQNINSRSALDRKKTRVRNKIRDILDDWQAKGFISGHNDAPAKGGEHRKRITKVVIDVRQMDMLPAGGLPNMGKKTTEYG